MPPIAAPKDGLIQSSREYRLWAQGCMQFFSYSASTASTVFSSAPDNGYSVMADASVSPKQYILGKRLVQSQYLLAKTDLSVKEIAESVGFENENYFSEYFSAKIGISALRYRAGIKGKGSPR